MYYSLLWLTLHIRMGINISHLSIPGIVAHGRCYISHCFVLCVCFFNFLSCSACILQMRNKPNQFLIQINVYFFIIIYLIIFCFFFLLIKQLFSHEMVKFSRLFCLFVLFLELKLQGNNSQLHYFFPIPKRFLIFFSYFHFNIILHFILKFTLFLYHSFYRFILTVTSEQNVSVAP